MQKRNLKKLLSLSVLLGIVFLLASCRQVALEVPQKQASKLVSNEDKENLPNLSSSAASLSNEKRPVSLVIEERGKSARIVEIPETIEVAIEIEETVEITEEPIYEESVENDVVYEESVIEEFTPELVDEVVEEVNEPVYTYESTYETIVVPYDTLYILNDQMDNDQGYPVQFGQDGEIIHTWLNVYEDGILIDSHITKTSQSDAVPEIMMVGSNIVVVPAGSTLEAEKAKIDALPKAP